MRFRPLERVFRRTLDRLLSGPRCLRLPFCDDVQSVQLPDESLLCLKSVEGDGKRLLVRHHSDDCALLIWQYSIRLHY